MMKALKSKTLLIIIIISIMLPTSIIVFGVAVFDNDFSISINR